MPKVYSYLRFSSPDQALGDSKRRQIEAARKWAEAHGLTIDEEMADLGISAYRGKHRREGALRDFLAMVEDGLIEEGSTLIVESLDRLSREGVMQAFGLISSLLGAGIRIVTLGDQAREYVGEPNIGDLMYSLIVLSRAHEESRVKSERIAAAWENKRKQARDGSDRRALTRKLPEWLTVNQSGQIEPITERVAVIKEIFRLATAGVGRRRIVQALNERGEPTWGRATLWHDSYVTKLLGWRAVLGEYQPYRVVYDKEGKRRREKDGEPIADYYPQVIDPVQFSNALAETQKRRLKGGRQGKTRNNVLTGLVRCGSCKGTMVYESKGKGKKAGPPALRCYRYGRKAGCDHGHRYMYGQLEMAVLSGLSRASLRALASDETDHLRSLQVKLTRAQADLGTKNNTLAAFVDNFGVDTSPKIAEKMRLLAKEITMIEAEVEVLEKDIEIASSTGRLTGDELYDMIREIYARQRVTNETERYVIRSDLASRLRLVIDEITCQAGKAEIVYKDGSKKIYDDDASREARRHQRKQGLKNLQAALSHLPNNPFGS